MRFYKSRHEGDVKSHKKKNPKSSLSASLCVLAELEVGEDGETRMKFYCVCVRVELGSSVYTTAKMTLS
jgi:hypothetical protein